MTDKQINQRIAEACGWTEIQDCVWRHHKPWGYPPLKAGQGGNAFKMLPDYCNDLNAMHLAEKVLTPKEEGVYFFTLKHLVGDLIWHRDTCRNYRATARQRAEAFLCALGKYTE